MKVGKTLLSSCVAIIFSAAIAQAGPCNTGNKDAGSGPTPGHTTQTIGAAPASRSDEHPPTATMNKAAGNVATSSEDAQRQMQGQPTAAQDARGQKTKDADEGC
jgi:hypothetical protein